MSKSEVVVLDSMEINDLQLLNKNYEKFKEFTNNISSSIRNIANEFMRIGYYLLQVRDLKLYELDSFKDIYEYSEKMFGLGNTSTKNYIGVFERFATKPDENPRWYSPTLEDSYKKYSFGQLVELLPVADKIDDFKPSMTVKEIRVKKVIDKLDDFDKKIEIMLSSSFPDLIRNFFASAKAHIDLTFKYSPGKDGERSLSLYKIGKEAEIEIYKNPYLSHDELFIIRLEIKNPCFYKDIYFTSLDDLSNLLSSNEEIKSFVKTLSNLYKKKIEVKTATEAIPEATVEDIGKRQLLKNDKAREDHIQDMDNWELICEVPVMEYKFYRFKTLSKYYAIFHKDQLMFYFDNPGHLYESRISYIVAELKNERI